jgi:hypothetical protein
MKGNNGAGAKKVHGRREVGKKESKMRGGNNVRTPRVLNLILHFGTQKADSSTDRRTNLLVQCSIT